MRVTNVSGGGSASISVNGKTIEMRGGNLYVNGRRYAPADGGEEAGEDMAPKELKLDGDGRFVGDIYGDVYIHGNNVTLTIEGRVDGSVRADGHVNVGGKVGGSATAGGDLSVGEKVGGSANAGKDIHVQGKIGGSANAGRDILRR